jgi:hypothetical protein
MKRYYKAVGNVRGACTHRHTSVRTAYLCAVRDGLGLSGGAYSDRLPCAFEDGDRVEMTDSEIDMLDKLQMKLADGTALRDL